MLLVLPPSRGQTRADAGSAPLEVDDLALPSLSDARNAMLDAVEALGSEHPRLDPAAPAAEVLTGVLYAAAELPRILRSRGAAAQRAARSVLIASPLLGMHSPADRIPASRLSMSDATALGSTAKHWQPALARALDVEHADSLVVDVRSSEFLPLWRPPVTSDWVSVRVEQERNGARTVVSHHAKHLRGVLVRHLLTRRGATPTDAAGLRRAARGLVATGEVLDVELTAKATTRGPRILTLLSP